MKKITVVSVIGLMLLILINPSKMSVFGSSSKSSNAMKEIIKLEDIKLNQYIEYNGRLCFIDDNILNIIDEMGNEIYKQQVKSDDIKLSKGRFIDIINESTGKCYSLNEEGKTQFATTLLPETILYRSMNQYVYVTVSKSEDKEILRILNDEGGINKKIEIEGNVTNIKAINDKILVSYLSIGNSIINKIEVYDQNGNLKDKVEFNGIVLNVINQNESIYVFLEDKIEILDTNLNKKNEINVEGIKSIKQSNKDNIYIKNTKGELNLIEGDKLKNIKNMKDENIKLEGIDNSYILYSDNTIYNDKLKEIKSFNQEINDVVEIGTNNLAIIFKESIAIYRIQ
ncbi:MAG: hypothetical protein ACRDD7_12290 [Peptostreptococcaceae bacterium]